MRTRRSRNFLVAACCLLAVGAAACGGSDPADHPGHTVEPGGPPTALPAGDKLISRCTDGVGDGRDADLTEVVLAGQADTLVVEFAFAGPVPADGAVGLAVEARSRDGATVRQLGVKIQSGQPGSAFVGTGSDSAPQQLDGAVHVADGAVHAAFPSEILAALGPSWTWQAVVAGPSGIDDLCPGDADATISTGGSVSVG